MFLQQRRLHVDLILFVHVRNCLWNKEKNSAKNWKVFFEELKSQTHENVKNYDFTVSFFKMQNAK